MRKFRKVYIEITNVCNLSCSFCPKTTRKPAFMDKELFERILGQVQGRSSFIYFHIMGEPLLHPELPLFLDLSEKYGCKVNITTNGTLIGRAGDMLLTKKALRQVNFSLHSFEANESVCSMEEYLEGIFDFVVKAREKKVLTCFRLWNNSCDGKNSFNEHILRRIEEVFRPELHLENKTTPVNGIKITDYVFLNQSGKFDWPDANAEEISDRGFCYGLRDQIGILSDGTVVPCCLDSEGTINLGNIRLDELEQIVTGERAARIYEGFSRRLASEELCRKCGYRRKFDADGA
jgi:radical SAM protein with 4Fe4S-binding SPASM domain